MSFPSITRDIRGEARIVERAFGIDAYVLLEIVTVVKQKLGIQAT